MADPEFGVNTSNPFAFLDEDAPAPASGSKPKKEVKKKEVKSAPKREDSKPKERAPRGEARGQRTGSRGGRRGGGRGGRGGRGREFDRKSNGGPGTGRNDTEKRGGGGKYNWGEEGTDDRPRGRNNRARDKAEPTATEEEPAAETAAATEGTEGEEPKVETTEGEAAEPEPEEPETMSYDEYIQAKKDKQVADDLELKARTVSNDDFQGKSATAFVKDEEDEGMEYVLGTAAGKGGKKKGKKEKNALNIDEFKAQNGGSGGYRSGRGRGRGRGRGGRTRPINMDESNFPKLG